MLASSFSFEAGTRLRAKRERLHLSIRRVAQMSQKIAQEKNDPAFFVPHNWISDLENGKSNRDYYRGFTVSASSTIVTSTKSWPRSASTSLTWAANADI
jgi:hypothetical protein